MTKLLDKAFKAASKLPEDRQDEIAAKILDDVARAARRTKRVVRPKTRLEQLVAEADAEIAAGRVYPLEFPRRR